MLEKNQILASLGLIKPDDEVKNTLNMYALRDFSAQQILEAAANFVMNSKKQITVFDICEYFRSQNGVSSHDLEIAAEQVFNELLLKNDSVADWIVADWRAAVTIRALYISPQRFNLKLESETNSVFTRKDFIERYLKVTDKEFCDGCQYFPGKYSQNDNPHVVFLGDYQKCSIIVMQVYAGRHPRLPRDPATPVKALPKIQQDRPATLEERTRALEMVRQALEDFSRK